MIDTHCHLDDRQFAHDIDAVLAASVAMNVTRWLLIGYDPTRWDDAIAFAARYPGMYHTLGVHPAEAPLWNTEVESRLRQLLSETSAVAIGEAGLDFYRDNAPYEIQAEAFQGQIRLAAELNLPLIIHMRDAENELLDILGQEPILPKLVFHSFDGSAKLMDFILASGSHVGIGGLATRQKSDDLRTQLARVPLNRILLETDSPYLVPARQKDRRNQPKHIATIATMMAEHLDIAPEMLATYTTENAERLFGLHDDR